MTGITEPQYELEARDTELAISVWNDKAKQFGAPPRLGEFDLGDFGAKSYRFLICADMLFERASVFLEYGLALAKLLGLPERPSMHVPMIDYIPDRYRFAFSDGCRDALEYEAPVRFSGEIAGSASVEFYRACFMPLGMSLPNLQTIYGSFNYLTRPVAELREQSQRVSPDHSQAFGWLAPGDSR
jgi:hypothetical protein